MYLQFHHRQTEEMTRRDASDPCLFGPFLGGWE